MKTITDLDRWLASAPEGTSLSAQAVRDLLAGVRPSDGPPEAQEVPGSTAPDLTWKERLWLAPAETRIGVRELVEAIGRPTSWIYRHTSSKAVRDAGYQRLPFRKLDGELVFVVGELRAWIRDSEQVIAAGRMESEKAERAGWRVVS